MSIIKYGCEIKLKVETLNNKHKKYLNIFNCGKDELDNYLKTKGIKELMK